MDFIISCCGTVKSVDIFEQARVACTQPNWDIPPAEPLSKLLQILNGNNPEYDSQTGFSNLLVHLQQDEMRKNVTFVLKNLIILDLTVEDRLFLSRIGRYYNSQLIYMQGDSNSNKAVMSIKDLIASYYVYIKEKSKYYELQSKELLEQKERQKFMEKANSITILNQINVCFKIQNLILDVNSKFKNGDKSAELIRFIFGLMLKTYIFCHSIVSIALKTFAKRIPDLNRYDLEYIKKFATYFNKDYSKNFVLFITTNQAIPYFQNVDYKQMIVADTKMLQIIQIQLQYIYDDPGICPEPIDLSPEDLKAMAQQKKEEPIKTNETLAQDSQILNKRKELNAPAEESKEVFLNYTNFYSDSWQSKQVEGETLPPFMDPYEIYSYYGAKDPSEKQEDGSEEEQEEEDEQEEEVDHHKGHEEEKNEISVNE